MRKRLTLRLLTSMLLILSFSCKKEGQEEVLTDRGATVKNGIVTERLDSSRFSYQEEYYIDLAMVTKSYFLTAASDTSYRSIVFRSLDTVNYVVRDDYYSFSTEKGYFDYTDGVRGLDEAAQDNIDKQVTDYLTLQGVTDSASLTPVHLAAVDSIRGATSLMVAGPLRSFHINQFDNPPLIGNNFFLILPGYYENRISSYQTRSDPLFTWRDKFYDKILCKKKSLMVTYVIPKAIEGWTWKWSFIGLPWDNKTSSWRKTTL